MLQFRYDGLENYCEVEAQGKVMIAFCSKTYILKKHYDKVKFGCKGWNKSVLKEPFPSYQEVLKTGETKSSTNQGFRLRLRLRQSFFQQKYIQVPYQVYMSFFEIQITL